jgi:oligopeptide/dipeptide ABC transporter ATP-binding protein
VSGRLLEVVDLRVTMHRAGSVVTPVNGVSFSLDRGEILGIVGESGSGKTLTIRAIIGLLPPGGTFHGDLRFSLNGGSPVAYTPSEVHGLGISIVFQEPMTALNPTMRVGDLITEGVRTNEGLSRSEVRSRTLELMRLVGIPGVERRARMWPHQLSGGLRQRVMIAAALSTQPKLLLCDEPTTALDVSIQDQILGLLLDLRRRLNMAIIFVSHDLAVIGELCDRIAVMYAGQIVETGPVDEVVSNPHHPYTAALIASIPSFHDAADHLDGIKGRPPDPRAFPAGCRFADRCAYARDDCRQAPYSLASTSPARATACIHPEVLAGGTG